MRTTAELTGDGAADRRPPVLIVGVGSELRSDDAAGRRVAELMVGRHAPGEVEVLVVHQLTPELADAVTGRQLVVVVDASVEVKEVTADVVEVDPAAGEPLTGTMSHHLDVTALMGLAQLLGERPMQVSTIAVPASDLTLGTGLSPGTEEAVSDAVARIMERCRDVLGPTASPEQPTFPTGTDAGIIGG